MSKYEAVITPDATGEFYAVIVRNDNNGRGGVEQVVVHGFKGRYFKTRAGAERATTKCIKAWLKTSN